MIKNAGSAKYIVSMLEQSVLFLSGSRNVCHSGSCKLPETPPLTAIFKNKRMVRRLSW